MGGASTGAQTESAFGIDDLTFDVVTLLYEKSKGLEAYTKYVQDAARNPDVLRLLEHLHEQDRQSVLRLKECLADLIAGAGSGASATRTGADPNAPEDDIE